jgi:hypothetical protein
MYSILAIAIVLLAAFVPSCGGTTTGTIDVKATLCGIPWQGAVNYTLTPTGGSPVNGVVVPTTHSSMAPSTWTCAYVSGGPAGAFLNSIKPSASQSLVAGGTITFTFDFELDQDAAIQFSVWSQNGVPFQGPITEIVAEPCNIVDAHFNQWVKGCDGYNVTMNEASWFWIRLDVGPAPVQIVVVDDWCALNKTPAPRQKVSQTASVDNVTRLKGYNVTLQLQTPTLLDVHTQWELVKGVNYTKAINWFGISTLPMFETLGPHPCVLFELVVPMPGIYQFTIQTWADVEIVGDTDVDPGNNHGMSLPIMLIVTVP